MQASSLASLVHRLTRDGCLALALAGGHACFKGRAAWLQTVLSDNKMAAELSSFTDAFAAASARKSRRVCSGPEDVASRELLYGAEEVLFHDSVSVGQKRKPYLQTKLQDRERWQKELLQLRDEHKTATGSNRLGGILVTWIKQTFPETANDEAMLQTRRRMCWRLLGKKPMQLRAARSRNTRSKPVKLQHRKRDFGAGRPILGADIGYELYQWVVDNVRHIKSRLKNCLLLAQAEVLKADFIEFHRQLHESNGTLFDEQKLRLPVLNSAWISAWRKEWRVSWRARTIIYKVALYSSNYPRLHNPTTNSQMPKSGWY